MITIKQIESPVVVTDGSTDVNLYAGQTYTCEVPVVNDWFEMEIDTLISASSPSDSFILPFNAGDLTVDWESNGVLDYITDITGLTDSRLSHTYSTTGLKIIRIKGNGTITSSAVDKNKITSVKNCGSFVFTDVNFFGYSNLVWDATDPITTIDYSFSNAFRSAPNLTNFPNLSKCLIASFRGVADGSQFDSNIGYLDLRSCTDMLNFARNVTTWSTANYNASLMGFLRMQAGDTAPPTGWVLKSNVPFHAGNAVATGDGLIARSILINTFNWTITDSTP